MNKLEKFFKVVISILLVGILIVGIVLTSLVYKEYYRPYESYFSSKNDLVVYKNKGKVRLNDNKTSQYLTPNCIELNGKYGVIDSDGKIIIEPVWDNIECLNPGLFAVQLNGENLLLNKNRRFIK